MTARFCRRAVFAALLVLIACAAIAAPAVIPDFTFAQCSDDHNQTEAGKTISEFKDLHAILLKPYNITSLPVSFIVDTGDMTEFGPTDGLWRTFNSFYDGVTIPRYVTLGNHDNTWRSLDHEIRQLYGSIPYSFDKFGCHFCMLDSAGLQDPYPNLGPEQITWLRSDLRKIGKDVPVFICMHHPLNDPTEWACKYEVERMLDVIRPYNVILVLFGHGHNATHGNYEGIDWLEGGSTYPSPKAGYQVICISNGVLYVAYKDAGAAEATKAMITKPIAPPAKRYPAITIDSPKEGATYRDQLPIKAWVALGRGEVASAYVEVDGANKTDLTLAAGGAFTGTVSLKPPAAPTLDLNPNWPGAHDVKVTFVAQDKAQYSHSTFFYTDSDRPKVLWRVQTGTASKTTPTLSDTMVYIGGYDGTVRAYIRKTGKWRWTYQTGGPVLGQILLLGDKLYAGSDDTYLYCLDAQTGRFIWKFQAEDPIFSSPVSDGTAVYSGCGTGAFYSVDAKTGGQNWKNSDAKYNIESKPYITGGKVYYGAWDCYVYCVNTADGKLVWKCMGQGSAEKSAPRYYSPADAGPVSCGGVIFAPDRKYRCSLILDSTGKQQSFLKGVASATTAADGKSVYLRMLGGGLEKVDAGGNNIWTADVPTDDCPATPTEAGGIVYVCSKRGIVSAVSASDGKLLWQYRATPGLRVLAGVGGTPDTAYVMGTDGSLTALVDPTPGVVK